jgi:hypothetical protein
MHSPPECRASRARFAALPRPRLPLLLLLLLLARCTVAEDEAAERPLTKCRLAIVGAGSPRTGSTHLLRLANLSLGYLGFGAHAQDAGYWKWHLHSKMPPDKAKAHLAYEQARAAVRPSTPLA